MNTRRVSDYFFYLAIAAILGTFLYFFVVNNREFRAEKGCWPAGAVETTADP